jgi:general secretion pathway protein K
MKGFALLIVLWTMGLLALLGTQLVAAGRSDTRLASNLKQEAVLAAAAEGAAAHVTFMLQAAHDPQWQADGVERELRIGATPVLVRVQLESDRVNLNSASQALMRALLMQVGAAPAEADRVAAAVMDWRTSGNAPRKNGAKAPEYLAAGLDYGPPGTVFQSVDELRDVLGMTPDLFARVAPHLTVLTDGDPDMNTRDPIVAAALTDVAGVADDSAIPLPTTASVLRITVTAIGADSARVGLLVVASDDFRAASPHVNILLHERVSPDIDRAVVAQR